MKQLTFAMLTVIITCSFTCSKTDQLMSSPSGNAQFDFTEFPGNCSFVITSNQTGEKWRLNTDSLRMYELQLPSGTFQMKWKMFGNTIDSTRMARMKHVNHELEMIWGNEECSANHWKLTGLHKFIQTSK